MHLLVKDEAQEKRSVLQLFRLGMIYMGVELLFSIEIALTVPIMLKLKVSEE
jgi:hypothetical protein